MRWEAVVDPLPSASGQVPPGLAPALLVLATVAFALLIFRRLLKGPASRLSVPTPSGGPLPPESNRLPAEDVDRLDASQPVAVLLVGGDHFLGPASVRIFGKLYSKEYGQTLLVSVAVIDEATTDEGAEGPTSFRRTAEAKGMKKKTRLALDPVLASAHELGFKADCRVSVATDVVEELDVLSDEIAAVYPRAAFFVSKLVFQKPTWFHPLFHRGSGDAIRARLEKKGRPITVLPFVGPL